MIRKQDDSVAVYLNPEWLINQEHLGLTLLHDSGHDFNVIHACELREPAEFVNEESIVLLTGLAFEHDPDLFRPYVKHLSRNGIVGVGFGIGVVFDEIPEALLEAAIEENVTLFTVPRPTPFVAIAAAVAQEHERQRHNEREWLLDQQTKLSVAASNGLENLLNHMAQALEAHAGVIDSDGRTLGLARAPGIPHVSEEDLQSFVDDHGFAAAGLIGELKVLTYRMQRDGERSHSMAVVSARSFTSQQRLLLRHCAGLAELLLQRPAALRRSRQEINALAVAVQLGIEKDHKSIARVFKEAADSNGEIRPILVLSDTPQAHTKMILQFDRMMGIASRLVFAMPLDQKTSVILVRGERTIEDIRQILNGVLGNSRAVVGAPIAWQRLDKALLGKLRHNSFGVSAGEVSGTRSQLLEWAQNPETSSAIKLREAETWGRLNEKDQVHGSALVETLETYLRTNGHLTKTADSLAIHRQTLAKRIREIEAVLEMDLANPLVRAELIISAVSLESGELD